MENDEDLPKSLGDADTRAARHALIDAPHVSALNRFVSDLREKMGPTYQVPYFDPMDGGTDAECLFLLEAPGPNAVKSGFISRNNPDETAKNFFLLNRQAGIDRRRTVTWNVVPWYIGTDAKIRSATGTDLRAAEPALRLLLSLLPRLTTVVLIGRHAQKARLLITSLVPGVRILTSPHPSPMFINRAVGNRQRIVDCFRAVSADLSGPETLG